jgi:hypothetical protein
MKNNIEIVAPDFKNTNGVPAINTYPAGQTIGYMNYTSEGYESSLYVRILDSTPKLVIPVLPIEAEFMGYINKAIESAENVSFNWVGKEQIAVTLTPFKFNEREGAFTASILEDK